MNLLDALANTNVRAFLKMIRYGEGTFDDDGYRRMFGGKLFDGFADHPRQVQTVTMRNGKLLKSSAAGAYQFLERTWDAVAKQYGFTDFSPHSQDLAAIALIIGRKALDDVMAGRFDAAVTKCNREWASLPGSPYGQPTVKLPAAREVYAQAGGAFADGLSAQPQPPVTLPTQETPMAPFILAALPALFDAVPKLIKSFTDDGVSVPKRNEQAVSVALDVAKAALGVDNEQALSDKLKTDPEAAAIVRSAIDASWAVITDATGINDARKADAALVDKGSPVWRSPSFVIATLLLPLAYGIVGAVVGLWGSPFSDDVRSAIANGVIGLILGGLSGYYFGQTTSRNRTPPATGTGQ